MDSSLTGLLRIRAIHPFAHSEQMSPDFPEWTVTATAEFPELWRAQLPRR
jgi:hypothetical protein